MSEFNEHGDKRSPGDRQPGESSNEKPKKKEDQTSVDLEKNYITRGFLSMADLLCVKCVEKTQPDDVVLWFVDFLVHKDMLSKYEGRFRSCLVSTFPWDINHQTKKYREVNTYEKKYKVVIKKKSGSNLFSEVE
ncbi:unnamed protein product [Colias eurytheme]|nr:unnamed protein product [Colias eurytheme]